MAKKYLTRSEKKKLSAETNLILFPTLKVLKKINTL